MRRTRFWSCLAAMALVFAGARFTAVLAQSGCTVTLDPMHAYVPYAGSNLSFTATTTGYKTCGLTVSGQPTWINVQPFINNSPTRIDLQVSTGALSPRAGAVTVASGNASASFLVDQSGSVQITSPTSLSSAMVGVSYGPVTFAATNGVGVYSWSASGIPPGLSFSSSGVLSGTPAIGSQGNYQPVFVVTDSGNTTAIVNLPLTITNSVSSLSITSPSSLSSGAVGVPYGPITFAANGGTSGYTWSATGLPNGLSFSAGGVLSGTPATGSQGAYTLHFTVKDSSNTAATATLALTINPSAGSPLFLGCLPLGTLTVGIAVSGGCSVFGGTSPYVFSISAGALPAGLTLNSDTGMIGGTPTTAGPYSFTVGVTDSSSPPQTVTDAQGDTVNLPGSNSFVVAHTFDAPSFTTTIILINSGTVPAPYSLQFYDESGNVPASLVALQLGSLTGTIPAGNSTTIRTAGTGDYLGWAQVTAPASVAGSVIYSQKNQLPTIQEGTTTLAPNGSQHFFVPFDNTNGAISSLALTNPGTSPASITVTLHYTDGTSESPSFAPLLSRNHESFAIPDKFPNATNRTGVAEFSSTSPLYTVAFRFNPTLAFTALDVVQPGAASPSITRTLAHAVDAGSFKTTVLLTNTGTTSATYLLQFNDEQGNDPSPPVALDSSSSPLTGSIPPGGLATIRTAGAGPFLGWAQLIAPASVGGSVIYSQKNQLPSIQEGTATIVVTGTEHFFVPFDDTNGAVTAMALTNPGASAVSFTVTLRYSDGTSETPAFPPLASRNHESFAIPDKFPNASNRGGVAEFVSSSPVNAVAFRFNPTLAFTAFGIVSQ